MTKKAPRGVWSRRLGGGPSAQAKRRAALTKRSKKVKVTLPGIKPGIIGGENERQQEDEPCRA